MKLPSAKDLDRDAEEKRIVQITRLPYIEPKQTQYMASRNDANRPGQQFLRNQAHRVRNASRKA